MSTLTENITKDKIEITRDLVKTGIMVNAGLSSVIIVVLLILVSGPGGAKSQISKASDFFSTPCIPTGNGTTGFKQLHGSEISPCDPSGNDSPPGIINNLLNGTASADLSGNTINIGKILITIGVISNILFIFSPYLAYIPRTIWLWILRKKAEKTVDDQLNRTKEPIKVAEKILKIDPKDTAEASRKLLELRNEELNRQFEKELGKSAEDIEGGQRGGGNPYFKFVTNFAGFIGGDKCDSGEATRFFIGATHIVIFLILGALLKGDPLSISPGLFGLFLSFLILFSLLGSLIPSSGSMKIFYAVGGLISFLTWLIIGFTDKNPDNPLTISSIIRYTTGILSISLFSYFSANPEDFTNKKKLGCPSQVKLPEKFTSHLSEATQKLGNLASKATKDTTEAASKATAEAASKVGGGSDGDAESIACLVYNFFSTINNSLAFGVVKIIIIMCGLIFTPNYGSSVKSMMDSLYGSRLIFFYLLILLFVMIWDFFPLLRWFTEASEAKVDKEDLFKKASELAFLSRCHYDPTSAPGEDDKGCVIPEKLKEELLDV
jgi:hypothetical protein